MPPGLAKVPVLLGSPRARRWLRIISLALAAGYLATLLLIAAGMRLVGEQHWLTTALLYAPRTAFFLPLPVATLLVARFGPRRLLWGTPLAIWLLLFPIMGLELGLGRVLGGAVRAQRSGEPRLRLLSYNAAGGPVPEAIAAVVRAARPDILLVQEWQDRLEPALLPEVDGFHRHRLGQFWVASRFPIEDVYVPPVREVVAANDRSIEAFLAARLEGLRTRHADVSLARFDKCLATLLRKQQIYRQQPTFMYFPHLPVIEFHDRDHFPWLQSIEAATDDIRAELLQVLAEDAAALQPYISLPETSPLKQFRELNNSRRWSVYYLWREGTAVAENLARCPRTAEALKAWPQCDVQGYSPSAVFSILDAKTRIPPHTGVSNTRLIVHLPLIVPPACGFRVGAERREWHPGKAFVFDDTIEHEAWNDGDDPRAVMIFDIWSPFVNEAEREMVRAATIAVGEYYCTRPYHEG
jgi:aspartyl/asparaginyl beta-hydroxylase (cupin superfamily)